MKFAPAPEIEFKGDPQYVESIRQTPSPASVKMMGRTRSVRIRPDWNTIRDMVMTKALRAKFTQNSTLTKMLLETGQRELAEHTARDRYWGDGGGQGKGQNKMGQLLMQLRKELSMSK